MRREEVNKRGHGQRRSSDQQNGGKIAEERLTGQCRRTRCERGGDAEQKRQQQVAILVNAHIVFAAAASHGFDGRNERSFPRRRIRGNHGYADADG